MAKRFYFLDAPRICNYILLSLYVGLGAKPPGKQLKSANNWQSFQNKILGIFFHWFLFLGAAFFIPPSPWTSCGMTRRLAWAFQHFWCSYPLQNPNDVFLFFGGTVTNLRNLELRTHYKQATSLLSIYCCHIDYKRQTLAGPREKTSINKQRKLNWKINVRNGVNETQRDKYCPK